MWSNLLDATRTATVTALRKVKRDPVTATGTLPPYATQQCADAAAYSSACSCWGYTSTVVTVTSPTTTVTATASSTCTPGLEYAFYALSEGTGKGHIPDNFGNYEHVFSTDSVKGVVPTTQGVSKVVNFFSDPPFGGSAIVDGMPTSYPAEYAALAHRAYFLPKQTGTYTLVIYSDDIGLIWLGANAVSGWTVDNADVVAIVYNGPATYTFQATAGDVIPFRILYANAIGESGLSVTFTAPDGSLILNGGVGDTGSTALVTSCSGPLADVAGPWPAWESES
jgi:hypothetical protein